jgi:ACS family hexuronate transporter-like MFS transporter
LRAVSETGPIFPRTIAAFIGESLMRYVRGLRWYILGLIFTVTCINLVDRCSVGLLFTQFGVELGMTKQQYSLACAILLFAYTVSQSVFGYIFDRFGLRVGYSIAITLWCVAAMAHSLIAGIGGFLLCSFLLGFGEAGNWPGAAKVIAEWFPVRERAFGMAVFNAGSSIGGVLGPLIVAGWLGPILGWRLTFLVIGSLGFVWLFVWLKAYHPVQIHPNLSPSETRYIVGDSVVVNSGRIAPSFRTLLLFRKTWAILFARFLVDPIWWFYMLWLPLYLRDVHGLNLQQIGFMQWVPYFCAAVGSLTGGWLSGHLIKSGQTVNAARKTVIGVGACLMPVGILAAHISNATAAVVLISIVLFGFQMWISNVQTLPSDCFPEVAVGSVAGLGGSAAGISSLLFNVGAGWMVTHYGYELILTMSGLLAPVGGAILLMLIGRIEQVTVSAKAQM